MRTVLPLFLFLLAACSLMASDEIAAAQKLFQQFETLGKAFDPSLAGLYSDQARIQNARHNPTGQTRTMTLPAKQYKELLVAVLPTAKERGDVSSYSEVKYVKEGAGVRITATRYSHLKKYSSPFSMLVAPDASGRWQIIEELSESRP
jgi:hypothetical protein